MMTGRFAGLRACSGSVPALVSILLLLSVFCAGAEPAIAPDPSGKPYSGPLFDAMTQWDNDSYPLAKLLERAHAARISRIGVFVRRPHAMKRDIKALLSARNKSGGFLVAGTPKYFREKPDGYKAVAKMDRRTRNKGYTFVSEILYRHADKAGGEVNQAEERYDNPLSTESLALIANLQRLGVPVMIHWEMYDCAADAPRFEALFRLFPQQKFIIAHLGFGSPGQVTEILGRHPNVYMTISKRAVWMPEIKNKALAAGMKMSMLGDDGRIEKDWLAVFGRFSGRLLFATDTHKDFLWDEYPDLIRQYRLLLGQLPPPVAQAIAYRNAERLYNISPAPAGPIVKDAE